VLSKEYIFKRVAFLSATLILFILASIFIMLFIQAKPAMEKYGIHFLFDKSWNKTVIIEEKNPSNSKINVSVSKKIQNNMDIDEDENLFADDDMPGIDSENQDETSVKTDTVFGGFIPIVGTILSTFIAMFFAVPLSMGTAVFLSEIAPKQFVKPIGVAIELLAAIPSIIYGMWGLFYFAPIVQKIFGGSQISLLSAGLVLGIMILPFMSAITRDSLNATPNVLKESAYALGATQFEIVKDIVFPYAKVGIIGSIILSLGRALGETMAVAFLIGSVFRLPHSLTDPSISIPVVLANNFGEANNEMLSSLYYLSFVLFVFSFVIIGMAKFYFLRKKR